MTNEMKKAYNKAYYERHKAEILEKCKKYREKHKDEISDINIYNRFKELFDKAKEQDNRSIHIVVTEPVEYEYDDW